MTRNLRLYEEPRKQHTFVVTVSAPASTPRALVAQSVRKGVADSRFWFDFDDPRCHVKLRKVS